MIRVGQIGLGAWGKNILRNLNRLGVLEVFFDSDSDVMSLRSSEYPSIHVARSFKELYEDPAIDAIVLSSPASTHYELAKQALTSGKHVFVEKPLSLTVNDGIELVDLAQRMDKILMVGHILRYHPAVRALKSLITDGKLGTLEYIYSNRLNLGKLRTEENILWSFAPHDISVILDLVGEEPTRVAAFGGDYVTRGIFDTTITALEFKRGVRAHIFVSWLHPYKEQKLIAVGSEAMAVFDDLAEQKLVLYPHKIQWRDGGLPVAQRASFEAVDFEPGEPLGIELEAFIESCRTNSLPLTDGAEGLRVLRVLHDAEQSLHSREP